MTEQVIQIPFEARPLQRVVLGEMHRKRFGVLVCHRRFGKTVLAVNLLQQKALMCQKSRPRVAYVGPTYRQAKAIAWDYIKYYAGPIPGVVFNESELRVDYPNGGQVRIYGGDDPNSLKGLYFDEVVLDEYQLHQGEIFTEVLRPAVSDRTGGVLFLGTPNGRNQFYNMLKIAQGDPDWFWAIYKVSQTKIIPDEELMEVRKVMSADEYAQEYECSFDAATRGAIYAKEIAAVRSEGRICHVPYDPILPVDTAWDLAGGGSSGADSTAIWFVQALRGGEIRLIDYYEAQGEGMPHFAKVLKDKGYAYGRHFAPHDIKVKEIGSGKTRIDAARALGIKFWVCPNIALEDGIHAVRMILPRCYFDAKKCDAGLEALSSYRRDYNVRIQEFKSSPVHDFASHACDALRYYAVSHMDISTPKRRRSVDVSGQGGTAWMG